MKAANGLNYRDPRGGATITPLTDAIHAAARNERSLNFRISDLRAMAAGNTTPTAGAEPTVPLEQVDAIDQILTPPAPNPMLFQGVQPTPPKNYVVPVAAGLGLATVFAGVIVALAAYVLDNAAARSPQQSAVNVMEASTATAAAPEPAAPTATAAAAITRPATKPTLPPEAASAQAAPGKRAPESTPQRERAAIDERDDRRPRRLTRRQLLARRRARVRRARARRARARRARARRARARRARARRARARRARTRRAALASHQTLRQDEIDALLR